MEDWQNIWKGVVAGDAVAFKVIYDEYSQMVYNTALSYTHRVEAAEDITQEVFTKVFKKASSFRGQSQVKTWIYRITINTSLNLIRQSQSRASQPMTDIDVAGYDHPGVILEQRENARYLAHAMTSLPDRQQTAFVLSYIDGLPRQEVADIMELSLKAVESLLMRAKSNMRQRLGAIYDQRRK